LGSKHSLELKAAPALQQLTLDLEDNKIGDEGACGLGELKAAPALQQLTLNLLRNKIGDEGACGLGELKA